MRFIFAKMQKVHIFADLLITHLKLVDYVKPVRNRFHCNSRFV